MVCRSVISTGARKTFKKQRLAVAESGARLSVRDAGVGGTRVCIATEVHRVCRTKAEKKRYTDIYIYIYICIVRMPGRERRPESYRQRLRFIDRRCSVTRGITWVILAS